MEDMTWLTAHTVQIMSSRAQYRPTVASYLLRFASTLSKPVDLLPLQACLSLLRPLLGLERRSNFEDCKVLALATSIHHKRRVM